MTTWLDEIRISNLDNIDDKNNKKYTLDLFKVILPAIDRGDKNFYNKLSTEEKAEVEKKIWIFTRYMSFSDTLPEHYIMATNELVNNNASELTKKSLSNRKGHPELQWLLLCLCGTGKRKFYGKLPISKGIKKNRLEEALTNSFPLLNNNELKLLLKINKKEDLEQFFKDQGYDDNSIKELFKNVDT